MHIRNQLHVCANENKPLLNILCIETLNLDKLETMYIHLY